MNEMELQEMDPKTAQALDQEVEARAEPQEFSGDPANLEADLKLLERQRINAQKPPEAQPEAQINPAQEEQPEAEAPKADVPEKFKDANGNLDVNKLAKSLQSVNVTQAEKDLALKTYLDMEKDLGRKTNALKQVQAAPAAQEELPESQEEVPSDLNLLAQKINADLKAGKDVGLVLAKLATASSELAMAKLGHEIGDIREESTRSKRERELKSIAKNDEWVLSPEGVKALSDIRRAKPSLTWTEAYKIELGNRLISQRNGEQVNTPTPKAVTAPPGPVTAAPRAVVRPKAPDERSSRQEVDSYLNALTPKEQEAYFASQGLKL